MPDLISTLENFPNIILENKILEKFASQLSLVAMTTQFWISLNVIVYGLLRLMQGSKF